MAPGIGASGVMGIALETTSGTYLAPTKFFPFQSESMSYTQDTQWRRPIRNTAGVLGAVPGDVNTEGDIKLEALHDVVPYFLMCSRASFVKTGAGPYVYTFTPTAGALPAKTASITIVKNGVVFAYTGVVVGSFEFTIENGMLKFTPKLVGRDEAVQANPTPTWGTSVPYGAGQYNIQIPTATQIFDMDEFTFTVEDNAGPAFRLKDTNRGAQFIKYGEREVTMKASRDFDTRTDYDAYKALTSQAITLKASQGASSIIQIDMPVAVKDEYTVEIGGQGDLIRAEISYVGVQDATGKEYTIAVTTTENIA